MKMALGSVFASDGNTYQFVKAVAGTGAFAYWTNPNKYEVSMGEFDADRVRADMAGVAIVGAVNVVPYPSLPWWSSLLFGKMREWYLEREYPICGPRYIFIQHRVTVLIPRSEVDHAILGDEYRPDAPEKCH